MGSMESLSSHSSEQITSSKTASSAQVNDKPLLHRTPSQLSNGPRSAVCISSPESSSREDAGRTDGESEDALSLSSVSAIPWLSPAPKKAPHCRTDLKPALMNRSAAPSLKSLHISEGRITIKPCQPFVPLDKHNTVHSQSSLPQSAGAVCQLCHSHIYFFIFLPQGRRSCSGSVQSLSTLEPKENFKSERPDLPQKQVIRRRIDTSVSNGYQRPGSVYVMYHHLNKHAC